MKSYCWHLGGTAIAKTWAILEYHMGLESRAGTEQMDQWWTWASANSKHHWEKSMVFKTDPLMKYYTGTWDSLQWEAAGYHPIKSPNSVVSGILLKALTLISWCLQGAVGVLVRVEGPLKHRHLFCAHKWLHVLIEDCIFSDTFCSLPQTGH